MQQFFVEVPLCSRYYVVNGAEGKGFHPLNIPGIFLFVCFLKLALSMVPKYPISSLTFFSFCIFGLELFSSTTH